MPGEFVYILSLGCLVVLLGIVGLIFAHQERLESRHAKEARRAATRELSVSFRSRKQPLTKREWRPSGVARGLPIESKSGTTERRTDLHFDA